MRSRHGVRRAFGRVARGRLAPLWVGLFSFFLAAVVTRITGVPDPEAHDEFSYLLAADTFAHGRVTNPAHPMWQHFESFHILQQPTYMSKYQPGQGVVLAIGQVVAGDPIVGSWLATALACAAICWALRAWLPPRWALLGALLAILHVTLIFFSQNYWGGSLAAAGGALVFGAVRRLWDRPSAAGAAGLVLGGGVLFNTRAYEGLVLSLLLVTPLLLFRGVQFWRCRPAVLTAAVLMLVAAGWTAYYNWRVTGHPFQIPYTLHESQYAAAPPLIWQNEWPAHSYRHESIREYYEGPELLHYRGQRTLAGFWIVLKIKLSILARAYLYHPALVAGLLCIPWMVATAGRRVRRGVIYALVALAVFVVGILPANWMYAHYAAPGVVLLIFLGTTGLRRLVGIPRIGVAAVVILLAATAVADGFWVAHRVEAVQHSKGRQRKELIDALLARSLNNLVIVRYEPGWDINMEWVYNSADIDRSPVVWARDMGPERNRELLEYFKDRTAWLLTVSPDGVKVEPYGSPG